MSNASTLTPSATSTNLSDKVRLSFLCLFAVSVSLGVAVISLAKILLLCYLPYEIYARSRKGVVSDFSLKSLHVTWASLIALTFLALTVFWAEVAPGEVFKEWFRHARLLSLLLVIYLIRNRSEAVLVMRCFVAANAFVVLNSWLLWMGVDIPWATWRRAKLDFAVFSSYIEQAVMTVVMVNIAYYCRSQLFPGGVWRNLVWLYIVASLANVLLVLPSMTGYIVLFVSILFFLVALKIQLRYWILVALFVLAGVYAASGKVIARIEKVSTEISNFQKQNDETTSAGQRLNYWTRALQSYKQAPILGHGVGSFNLEYNKHGGGIGGHSKDVRSPHSEYFLWMVEGGVVGLFMLLGVCFSFERDRRKLESRTQYPFAAVLLVLMTANIFNGMLVGIGTGEFFCIALALLFCLGWSKPVDPKLSQP